MSATFEQPNPEGAAPAAAPGTSERTFPTGQRARLFLDNARGSVRVTAWDRLEVHVRANKRHDASRARFDATRIDMSQDGSTVFVRTLLDPTRSLIERGTLSGVAAEIVRAFAEFLPSNLATSSVDYDVHVPFESELELKGVSADVAAEGTRGAYRIRTVSGTIDVNDVQGDADLGSVSGEIIGRGLSGRAHVDTVSGDVRLEGDVGALHGKSVSGNLELTGPLHPTGDFDLKSVSGTVLLTVPASTGASVTLRGVSADVHCDLPCTVTRNVRGPGHREWQGRIGEGGATIRFHSVSGDLRIRELMPDTATVSAAPAAVGELGRDDLPDPSTATSAKLNVAGTAPEETTASSSVDDAPESESTAASAPTGPEATELGILSALERGELTVDEALRRLDALRGRSA